MARQRGLATIGLFGRGGGKLAGCVDVPIVVPSDDTARIQETHIAIIHVLCELVDDALFPRTGGALSGRVTLVEGDVTEQAVDAIVNAANSALELGAGVAGAIREQRRPSIQQECDEIGADRGRRRGRDGRGRSAGALRDPRGGHAAGRRAPTRRRVRGSARRSFALASERGCRTIAVPAIGAGIGGFSPQRCAEVLLEEARAHLAGETSLEEIRFVLFGEPAYRIFESAKDAIAVREQLARMRRR